jgi:predicted nucleic acid-binding protein
VITVTKADCINARQSTFKDFEDALVVECAKKENLDFIVTRDKKFLSHPKTISPQNFLALFKA